MNLTCNFALILLATVVSSATLLGQEPTEEKNSFSYLSGTLFSKRGQIGWEHLLIDQDVQEVLQLTSEQKAELSQFQSTNSQELNKQLLDTFGLGNETKEEIELAKQQRALLNKKFGQKFKSKIDSTLLPIQLDRLNQIMIHKALSNQNAPSFMLSILSNEGSSLSPEEARKFSNKVRELQRELEKKILELRLSAFKDFVEELKPAERRVVLDRMGHK